MWQLQYILLGMVLSGTGIWLADRIFKSKKDFPLLEIFVFIAYCLVAVIVLIAIGIIVVEPV